MHTEIERDELVELLDEHPAVRVVMALGPTRFEDAHIPGSETYATVEAALAALDPDDDIVVYCSHEASPASRWACHLLVSRGFRRVRRYPGGLADWAEAGLPLGGRHGAELVEVVA